MPVKFGQTSIRFWFFLSYLITTVALANHSRIHFCRFEMSDICLIFHLATYTFLSNCRYQTSFWKSKSRQLVIFQQIKIWIKGAQFAFSCVQNQTVWVIFTVSQWVLILYEEVFICFVTEVWSPHWGIRNSVWSKQIDVNSYKNKNVWK